MRCPRCGFDQPGGTECIKCGIVFDKYFRKQRSSVDRPQNASGTASDPVDRTAAEAMPERCKELFLSVGPEAGNFTLMGRALILVVLLAWGLKFVFSSVRSNYSGESFLHLVNLPFHEAGHVVFRVFGQFMTMLGGSLTQVLVPLICLFTFLFKTREPFGASVSLWWLGENLIDLAPYINDARKLDLVLLGGVTGRDIDDFHDWEYILRKLGLLHFDHLMAKASHAAGALLMACAVVWGGVLLMKQLRNRRSKVQ